MLLPATRNTMEARDSKKSGQVATQRAEWLAAAWNGLAYDTLAVLLFGPRTAMPRRCECGLRNDEFHEPVADAGSSSLGRCQGRQCPRDDRRPCFSHRILCSRRYKLALTSTHQRRYVMTMGTTTHQLSVPAPHSKLLPALKSLTSAHEVMNQL